MAEFRNPVVLHYIDIWHLLDSNLILIFVTFLNSEFALTRLNAML